MRRELSLAGGGLHPHGHAVCSGVNSNRPIPGRSRGIKFTCRCSATIDDEASGLVPEVLYRCASVVCGLPTLEILQAGVLCRAAVGMVLVATVVNRDEGVSFGRCLRLDGTCRFWSAVRSRVHRQPVGVPQRLPRRPGTANGKRLGRLSRGRRQYPSAVLKRTVGPRRNRQTRSRTRGLGCLLAGTKFRASGIDPGVRTRRRN